MHNSAYGLQKYLFNTLFIQFLARMNVFYPSGSNIETNAFEINSCQPANSHNIPRIVIYMPNQKLCPFSNTRCCGALLSKELYKISHFQEHGNAIPLSKICLSKLHNLNMAERRSFENTNIKNTPFSRTRQCGAHLSKQI